MATTTARNKQDVDKMDRSQRLYDSLNYSYDKKGEKLSKQYDQAKSSADNQLLSRGMQRSSYGMQTLANIDKQKIDALDDNYNTMIADYENRLMDLEQQDIANEQWERQFAEGQRQYDTNLAFQQKEADRAQQNTVWNQNFQQAEADRAQANTAWQQGFNERQYADSRADNAWNQAFTERQYADSRSDTAWNQAFQTQQAQLAADQWEKEYASGQSSTDRQIALNNLYQIAAQGNDPTDALLQQAGLSRADFNAMKAQMIASGGAVSGGGGGNYSGGNTDNTSNAFTRGLAAGAKGLTDAAFNGDLFGLGGSPAKTTSSTTLRDQYNSMAPSSYKALTHDPYLFKDTTSVVDKPKTRQTK